MFFFFVFQNQWNTLILLQPVEQHLWFIWIKRQEEPQLKINKVNTEDIDENSETVIAWAVPQDKYIMALVLPCLILNCTDCSALIHRKHKLEKEKSSTFLESYSKFLILRTLTIHSQPSKSRQGICPHIFPLVNRQGW